VTRGGDSGTEFYGVQALRAIAALVVVLGHSTDYLLTQNGYVPQALAWIHGPAGVDIFFIISGFVMMISSGRLLEKEHPARIFLWRRVLRIVPLYWLLTALKLLLISAHPSLSVHARPSLWNVTSSFVFIPSLNASGEIRPLIPLGWTLSFEMLFYVVFALALTARQGLLRVLVPTICVLALVGWTRPGSWPIWTSLADPIVLEFLMGVGIARLVLGGLRLAAGASFGLLVAGGAGLILLEPGTTSLTMRWLVWGVPAAMIVLGTVALEREYGHRLPRWLLLLGSASYSIYLVQTFVFPVLHMAVARMGAGFVHLQPVAAGLAMMAASLVATSASGMGTYLLVERHMTEFFKANFGAERIAPVVR
jgi:exopolysaccharide production protein ExoZ